MYRILLVEDDANLASAMKTHIESWGNEVHLISDFKNIMPEFNEYDPHLVLMDIMLPFFNGYHWCETVRKVSNVPIIFLSSASDNMNIVMAMNMGGDDFIPKPVDPMVLTAKIQAILRRNYEIKNTSSAIEFSGATLNLNDGTVSVNDSTIELTRNEFRILRVLLENRGKIVSRDSIMNALWQDDCFVEENTLTVNIARLRKKLEDNGLNDIIITKPRSGYIIQ
ncbi:MAG: response regulator transcription factor [Clostridiales bacterium]|nr:response regulator transcription factor [Clostridiales bacterium]